MILWGELKGYLAVGAIGFLAGLFIGFALGVLR
jgi:hypothetical protein